MTLPDYRKRLLNIYLLTLTSEDHQGYDTYQGHVVAAASRDEARRLANVRPGDEGAIWQDASLVKAQTVGVYTGPRKTAHIILSDFNAG